MKTPIWTPSPQRVQESHITRYLSFVNQRYGMSLSGYDELYRWSVTDIVSFWDALWHFSGIVASDHYQEIVDDPGRMPGARWFAGAKLNFAENLLRYRDSRSAIIFKDEERPPERISYGELYSRVVHLAQALRAAGVVPGDRVAGYLPNLPETIIAMLAAVSTGAVWSACSPDFGVQGVLDRFGQIAPKVLFTSAGYRHKGTHYPLGERVRQIAQALPSLERVVLVPYPQHDPTLESVPHAVPYDDFLSGVPDSFHFAQLPAEHPLYVMYSSGTTGPPKCMVQGAAGVLANHLKELLLHTDLKREDRILYLTTCGWMMWNWLVSSLAVGATVVLYEGHPFHPDPAALWSFVEQEGISVFGTSARYLAALEKSGVEPGRLYCLSPLRTVLSTGSPLSGEGFRFVYHAIKADLHLASISGGTDINGCFALGNPTLPVYAGELQCRALGMRVEVFDASGKPVQEETGDLVCTAAAPSMPLYFWNDPDGSKYRQAYFERFPGVWTHGDWCRLTETGGMIIYGRSDATLNPGGVRIGTAELYRVVESLPEVGDSLAVGQRFQGGERIILFVRPAQGVTFDAELEGKISREIREKLSPRHVPAKIVPVAEIPYTVNMKKVELAVKSVIHGEPVTNREALANPGALELYRDLPQLRDR